MEPTVLLSQRHLSVLGPAAGDPFLSSVHDIVAHKVVVEGRGELEEALCSLLAAADASDPVPKTFDLIGHSSQQGALVLGGWMIDAARPSVRAFFRGLADDRVLPRLGVHAVRLLGCSTYNQARGQATVARLAEILELDVYGTRDSVGAVHYDRDGFKGDSEHLLDQDRAPIPVATTPYRRVLDVELLPAEVLASGRGWPIHAVDHARARKILELVARTDGAEMPGFHGNPWAEVAIPALTPGRYLRLEILLEGEFIRVFPDGGHRAGIVFPVIDPAALRQLLD